MTGKALAAAAAAAVALLVAGSAQPGGSASAKGGLPLLGIVFDGPGQSLVRVDRYRLRVLRGKRVDADHVNGFGGFSPHEGLLPLTRWETVDEENWRGGNGSLRIVDPYTMSVVRDVPLGHVVPEGWLTAWLAPDRLALLGLRCCENDYDLVVLDPQAGRVVERRPLHVDPIEALRAGDRWIVLAAPQEGIGPVQVLSIGAEGDVRSVPLDRIEGGREQFGEATNTGLNELHPALAVQPDGTRGFVFSPDGTAAEIDLASLEVTYRVFADRLRAPRAPAKRFMGSSRRAQLLRGGLVAVSGQTTWPYLDKNGKEHFRREAAGLELVDVSDWSTRLVDPGADSFTLVSDRLLTDDRLLATGSRWDSQKGHDASIGLTEYRLTGKRVFGVFKSKRAYVSQVVGARAVVYLDDGFGRVIDVGSGRVVAKRDSKTIPWIVVP